MLDDSIQYCFLHICKYYEGIKTFEQQWGVPFFPVSRWCGWHLWARNVFFSICFPKFHLPFCSSLFALCTSVTISGLAGSTLNSSAGTSASHSHLCPGLPNPFSLSTHLLSPFFRCCSPACMFTPSNRMNMLALHSHSGVQKLTQHQSEDLKDFFVTF